MFLFLGGLVVGCAVTVIVGRIWHYIIKDDLDYWGHYGDKEEEDRADAG